MRCTPHAPRQVSQPCLDSEAGCPVCGNPIAGMFRYFFGDGSWMLSCPRGCHEGAPDDRHPFGTHKGPFQGTGDLPKRRQRKPLTGTDTGALCEPA